MTLMMLGTQKPLTHPPAIGIRKYSSMTQKLKRIPALFHILVFGGVAMTAYGLYDYYWDNRVSPYPPSVRTHLRRALRSDFRGEHEKSIKHFQAALNELEAVAETSNDPAKVVSERAGILFSLGDAWEKFGQKDYARQAYQEAWQRVKNREDKAGLSIRTAVKLGDVTEDMMEKEHLYEYSVDKIVKALPKSKDGTSNITSDGLPYGISMNEFGAAMEALGLVYLETSRPAQAIAAFRAAQMAVKSSSDIDPCRDVVLWVNVASAFSALTNAELKEMAGDFEKSQVIRQAFHQGLKSYRDISKKNETCEMGATEICLGLGQYAADVEEAKGWFSEAKRRAKLNNDVNRLRQAESHLQTLAPNVSK